MAKRLIDTDIFKKKFIRDLDAAHKLFFLYIINDCNHAGVWECDFEVARIRLGVKVTQESAQKNFGDKVIFFDGDSKIFIPSFIDFQYGDLKEANRAHKSVIDLLSKYGLIDESNKPLTKPLPRPLQGCKDKDKDKDKDMDKDMKGVQGETTEPPKPTINIAFAIFWDTYDKKVGDRDKIEKKWMNLSDADRSAIMAYLPRYKQAQPDKKYRKNPETFLNNKSWNDEIVESTPRQFTNTMSEQITVDKFKAFNEQRAKKVS